MPNKLTDLSNDSPMLSNGLSNAEIKKALECCAESGDFTKTQDEICSPCPYCNCGDCTGLLKANALDLINRQDAEIEELKCKNSNLTSYLTSSKAEIERWKKENKILSKNADTAFQDGLNEAQDLYADQIRQEIKAEAYKEFAELAESKILPMLTTATLEEKTSYYFYLNVLNKILNELVGDGK